MVMIVAVLAVKPVSVEAKASDYSQDIGGWLEACQKVGKDLTKYNFTYGSHSKSTFAKVSKMEEKQTVHLMFPGVCRSLAY